VTFDERPNHFGQVAGAYAAFRPHYPEALFEWLSSIAPGHQLAWDAGTGSGQAAVALARHFSRVIATDLSAEQIANATQHPRVDYRVAAAERSELPEASVDLVTVAQALHWFAITEFMAEVTRVLVRSGAVAVWTYGVVRVDQPAADQVLHDFYYHEIGPWWPANRKMVEEGYRNVFFPFTRIDAPSLEMRVQWNLPELIGYIGTWSSVSRYRTAKGEDPLPSLNERLAVPWGNPLERREIRWPLSVLAGIHD
jgi:hypothetical protein